MDQPFLERDAPLTELEGLVRTAASGAGHTVFVTGDAGAGKTTLLRAFEARAGDARVLHGACEDLSIPEPLGALRDLAQAAGTDLDALVRDEADRLAVFRRVLSLVTTSNRATVVALEDLHWADEATLDFVRFAARRIKTRKLLMVVTVRDDEAAGRVHLRRALRGVSPSDVTRIPLRPLSQKAVARLAAGSGRQAEELHRVTGGNAFYVTELLRGDGDEGIRSVQDAVLDRLEGLPQATRMLLDAVSVFPRRAERDWALAAADAVDGEASIDECVAAGFLEDTGDHLAFRHEIARRAVETALSPSRRRRLNSTVLAAMKAAGGVPHPRLLHHARAAGDRAATARLAALAGYEARDAGANKQAAEYFALAVELADASDTEAFAALQFDAGEACNLVARPEEAFSYFERALRHTADQCVAARITQRLSQLHWAMGRKAQGRNLGDQAIAMQLGQNTPEHAMALANRAQIAMTDYNLELGAALARQAIALGRRIECWDIVAHALSTLSLSSRSDEAEMNAYLDEGLAIAASHGKGSTLMRNHSNGGVARQFAQDYPAALHHFNQAIALGREAEVSHGTAFDQGNRMQLLDRMGRWDEVESEAAEVRAQPTAQTSPAIMVRLTAARIAMRRGRPHDPSLLEEIVSLLGSEEDVRHNADVACFFAERAWLGLENRATAQSWLDRAMAMHCHPMLKEELLDWQRRTDPSQSLGPLDGVHASYLASFAGDWQQAAAEWSRIGDPYREALALAEGDAGAVTKALAILEGLGAMAVSERVRSAARDRGLEVGTLSRPRATTRANPGGLTRRQMDVLHLLNAGLPNAEIGARLFVSPKTVDHHVSAILSKLEVGTRGEAAALARAAGWLSDADANTRPN